MAITFFAIPEPLVVWHIAAICGVYFLAGFLIGVFNLAGGVLMVPSLMMLPGVTPVSAVGTVFISCCPMSIARMFQLWQYGMIRWKLAAPVAAGAAVSAFLGQLALPFIDIKVIKVLVGAVAMFAGLKELLLMYKKRAAQLALEAAKSKDEPKKPPDMEIGNTEAEDGGATKDDASAVPEVEAQQPRAPEEPPFNNSYVARGLLVGVLGGFISSTGGLGGPIVIMPLYLQIMPTTDIKIMIGIFNPVSNAMTVASVVGALAWGSPDVGVALILTLVLIAASLIGGAIQQRISSERLKPLICGILLLFGAFIILNAFVKIG